MSLDRFSPAQISFLERFVLSRPIKAAKGPDPKKRAMLEKLHKRLGALPPQGAAIVADRKRAIDKAHVALGGPDAADALDDVAPEFGPLTRDLKILDTYLAEVRGFEARLSEARSRMGGDGGIAIEDYVKRLEEDDQRRLASEKRGDIRMALVAIESQDNRHAAMMQEANRGRDYLIVKKEIESEIAAMRSKAPEGGDAKPAILKTEEMMEDALNFTKSGNWVGAVTMLRKARTSLRVETKGLDLTRKLDTMEPPRDFERGHARCLAMIKTLHKAPGSKAFRKELRAATELCGQANAVLPDMATAQDLLKRGFDTCKTLSRDILAHSVYDEAAKEAAKERKRLNAVNQDKCIARELKDIDQHLIKARKAAKAKRYPNAMDGLEKAGLAIAEAQMAAALYLSDVGPARKATAAFVKGGGDRDQAEALFQRMTEAYGKRDLAAAEKLSRELASSLNV